MRFEIILRNALDEHPVEKNEFKSKNLIKPLIHKINLHNELIK